ncbi:hypothetical protein GHNINEIG_02249 [Hydrogenovibrio crunogenus]|uniref:Uncharacterized protein n=1 Tax=Hydrogenovibrio crunogenus TaxID=39765 RepID=A0A4V1C950_9GAMM|nr:hypothetical protein [Hydrogenovibrio crunogenus]QBZ84174.1 hypothetical protein GHNINEIG_02249 [Hydrogenovibrio crunogenus]
MMIKKLFSYLSDLENQFCENLSAKQSRLYEKRIKKAENWCSEQILEQINSLTKDNAVLAYSYYYDLAGELLKDTASNADPKKINQIKQKAYSQMPIDVAKSIEKLVNEDDDIAKAVKNLKQLREIDL